jgi:hypothetical protein
VIAAFARRLWWADLESFCEKAGLGTCPSRRGLSRCWLTSHADVDVEVAADLLSETFATAYEHGGRVRDVGLAWASALASVGATAAVVRRRQVAAGTGGGRPPVPATSQTVGIRFRHLGSLRVGLVDLRARCWDWCCCPFLAAGSRARSRSYKRRGFRYWPGRLPRSRRWATPRCWDWCPPSCPARC